MAPTPEEQARQAIDDALQKADGMSKTFGTSMSTLPEVLPYASFH
jgi:hypothetical protein